MVTRILFDQTRRRLAIALPAVIVVGALGRRCDTPAMATAPGKDGQIAFKRYVGADQTTSAIFLISRHGKGVHQLTQPAPGVRDDQPDWSPDGSKIVFERCDIGCEVWTVSANGADAKRIGPDCLRSIPPDCETRINPAFSPYCTRIAFGRAYGEFNGTDARASRGRHHEHLRDRCAHREVVRRLLDPDRCRRLGAGWTAIGTRIAVRGHRESGLRLGALRHQHRWDRPCAG